MKPGLFLALGDSHLEALSLAKQLNILEVERTEICIVPGATIIGLRNPNSLTDAINIFRSFLIDKPRDSFVLTHMGEVDCGFVFWWRSIKYGESVEVQFKEGLEAYLHFLTEIKSAGFSRLCVAGASIPTIKDGVDMSDVANKRSEITVSLEDRTNLTLRFNKRLAELCRDNGIKYFDLTDVLLDRSSNLVCDYFRNPDARDHHLDKSKVVAIWASKCNDFLCGQ